MTSTDEARRPDRHTTGPLRSMVPLALCGLLVAAAGGAALSGGRAEGAVLAASLFALIAVLAMRSVARSYPHDRLGSCNTVTLLRAALGSAVAAPLVAPGLLAGDPALAWAVLAVALLALSLDGVDGWMARRSGLASDFGARFDMEVDQVLALVLACLALANGQAGLWVLALGGMRYGFLGAGLVLPWLGGPLPQRFRRKAVCVVQMAALIALLAPPVVPPLSGLIGLVATLLLAWSFAVDILWLARRR